MSTDPSIGNVWVNVVTFDELAGAKQMESILKNQRFEVQVQNECRLQRFWFAVKPQAGIHVQVRTGNVERVHEFLSANPEAKAIFKKAIRCPSCDSSRVQYPAMTRKNLLPALVAQVLVIVGIQKHEFYCEDCHFTWVRSQPDPQIISLGEPVKLKRIKNKI